MSDYYNKKWNIMSGSLNDDFKKALIVADENLKNCNNDINEINNNIQYNIRSIESLIRNRREREIQINNLHLFQDSVFNLKDNLFRKGIIINKKKNIINSVSH